jgi:hypothetical protein
MIAMDDQRGEQPDRQLPFLQRLIGERATIAGDIVEVGTDAWAIHGSIPVDGEVLIAEYDTPEQAHIALGRLPLQPTEPQPSDVPPAPTSFPSHDPQQRGGER